MGQEDGQNEFQLLIRKQTLCGGLDVGMVHVPIPFMKSIISYGTQIKRNNIK